MKNKLFKVNANQGYGYLAKNQMRKQIKKLKRTLNHMNCRACAGDCTNICHAILNQIRVLEIEKSNGKSPFLFDVDVSNSNIVEVPVPVPVPIDPEPSTDTSKEKKASETISDAKPKTQTTNNSAKKSPENDLQQSTTEIFPAKQSEPFDLEKLQKALQEQKAKKECVNER